MRHQWRVVFCCQAQGSVFVPFGHVERPEHPIPNCQKTAVVLVVVRGVSAVMHAVHRRRDKDTLEDRSIADVDMGMVKI